MTKLRRETRPKSSTFATKLLAEWRRLELSIGDASVVVAVSGGADSTALLLAMDELSRNNKLHLKIVVAHLDHGLRKESGADARWVRQMTKSLDNAPEIVIAKANLKRRTKTTSEGATGNLEQEARKARYEFLEQTARRTKARLILTAHTLDDQAETILMRLLRGSAADGLGGIVPLRPLASNSEIQLIRPLVSWAHRAETEHYCVRRNVDYRHDEMNLDESFSRVRVRKQLLPLMKTFNPRIVEALSRTAALLNEDTEALAAAANVLLEAAGRRNGTADETKGRSLNVSVLAQAPSALRRRALREWILRGRGDLRRVEMVHLLGVEALLSGERGGRVAELPGGMAVVRKRGWLEFVDKGIEKGLIDL